MCFPVNLFQAKGLEVDTSRLRDFTFVFFFLVYNEMFWLDGIWDRGGRVLGPFVHNPILFFRIHMTPFSKTRTCSVTASRSKIASPRAPLSQLSNLYRTGTFKIMTYSRLVESYGGTRTT